MRANLARRSRRAGIALAVAVCCVVAAGVGAVPAGADESNVTFVRVLRVTQQAYQPVSIRIWEKAPVGHQVYVSYKIFDAKGQGVFSASSSSTEASQTFITISQPYYSTSLTLRWSKVAYDGSRLPRGQLFDVVAFGEDFTAHQTELFRSSPYYFTLTS